MFEPNKSLASVHRFCTRNQNVDFRGPFFLGTENPSSWELSSQTSLFKRTTDVYFDLWLLRGVAEKRVQLRESADFWRPFDDVLRCGDVINDETRVCFSRSFGRIVGNQGVALAVLVDR